MSGQEAFTYPSGTVTTLPVAPIFNLFVAYRPSPNSSVGLGVSNLANKAWYAPQPYNGGEAPLPLPGREFYAKFSITF